MESAWDIAVVGAGAAGLVAALRAAELGRRVVLLEKNARPGVKILMSGGSRCNVTHATDNRGIVADYGSPEPDGAESAGGCGGGRSGSCARNRSTLRRSSGAWVSTTSQTASRLTEK